MTIKNIAIVALSSITFMSCNDGFMDRYPESINDATFWNNAADLKTNANNFYNILPGGLSAISDGESDNQVPNSRPSSFWNETPIPATGGGWSKGDWSNIRNLNYFMSRYTKAVGVESEINIYVAEVRFFRALEYAAKTRRFGDVPWLEKDLTPGDADLLYGKKDKRDFIIEKIIEDFDFAIQWLPEKPEVGRIGKDVARHLKARVCLYEGTYYKYHTELNLTEKAERLLQLAADAALAVINTGKYEIYSTGNPVQDYYKMFVIEDKSSLKEAILPVTYLKDIRMHNASRSLFESYTGFSKDFINSYLCIDGLPISESLLYKEDKGIENETMNRDPRLKQTVLTPGFPISVSTAGDSTFTEEKNLISKFCFKGYSAIKYFSPLEKDFNANACTYDGIAYRYAETLLIYAEAKAELGSIDQNDLNISINKLRARVAMPDLQLNVGFSDPNWIKWGYDLSPILQEIRRERRIELAGEGFRWDDLCRWKAGHICDEKNTYLGIWNNETQKPEEPYGASFAGKRKWDDKLYLRPIPTGELTKNPNLLPQNPGWI